MQLAVFLAHGLPNSSEKFYDLSGSFTHLALVLTCLLAEQRERSGRQLFVAVASVMWMTRYDNCNDLDIIFGPFLTPFPALYHPTRAVEHAVPIAHIQPVQMLNGRWLGLLI